MMTLDEKIKTDVIDHLKWDTRIDASKIKIKVVSGEVTLSGEVPTYKAKKAAQENVYTVSGVISVENDIEINYPDVPTDEEIKDNIETALMWNPDLRSYKLDAKVVNGWVTLQGTVDAYWKKLQAEWDALDSHGVIAVTNEIAVVPTEDIADETIAEDVIQSIKRNYNIFVDDVTVKVEDGRVTLTGSVPDYNAKKAAFNAAAYTLGVISVTNDIIVSPSS